MEIVDGGAPIVRRLATRYTVAGDDRDAYPVYEHTDAHGSPVPNEEEEHDCTPTPEDVAEGRTAAVIAAEYIREHVASGRYAACGISGDGSWPGPNTWFTGDEVTIVDHARGVHEEVTAHLEGGWTTSERMEVWAKVTAE
jgi:hypothetical protein